VNFDTTDVSVFIDGTAKATPGDYTIDGTAESFNISLATPLTSGAHDLVIAGHKTAWSGKIYV